MSLLAPLSRTKSLFLTRPAARRTAARSSCAKLSQDAIAFWREPIDLLFLDADQSFDGVTRDFREWGRHVRPGGFILVDTSQQSPSKLVEIWYGPFRFVYEVLPHETGFRVSRVVDSLTVVVRT